MRESGINSAPTSYESSTLRLHTVFSTSASYPKTSTTRTHTQREPSPNPVLPVTTCNMGASRFLGDAFAVKQNKRVLLTPRFNEGETTRAAFPTVYNGFPAGRTRAETVKTVEGSQPGHFPSLKRGVNENWFTRIQKNGTPHNCGAWRPPCWLSRPTRRLAVGQWSRISRVTKWNYTRNASDPDTPTVSWWFSTVYSRHVFPATVQVNENETITRCLSRRNWMKAG